MPKVLKSCLPRTGSTPPWYVHRHAASQSPDQEVVDNSVDEAMGGHCDRIEITLLTDGGVRVADNGRGMPVDIHPEHGVPGIELILTRLHAGGKFSGENYKFSGGLHGWASVLLTPYRPGSRLKSKKTLRCMPWPLPTVMRLSP